MAPDYNPDTSLKKIRINHEDCMGCGACMKICASGAIYYDENGLAVVDQDKCVTCGYCAYACPERAIIMY
jgi:ferredoxin